MNEDVVSWPENVDECAALARSMFVSQCVSNARYWIDWSADFLVNTQPETPYERSWSEVAKEDKAFREVFATLTEKQRAKVIELLQRCISGAVYSTLCTLDQFPNGEAEIFVRDGVCGEGTRTFRIAPTDTGLHDDFVADFYVPPSTDNDGNA